MRSRRRIGLVQRELLRFARQEAWFWDAAPMGKLKTQSEHHSLAALAGILVERVPAHCPACLAIRCRDCGLWPGALQLSLSCSGLLQTCAQTQQRRSVVWPILTREIQIAAQQAKLPIW